LSNFQFCPSYLTIFAVLTRVDCWLWPVDQCWPVDQFDYPIKAWHMAECSLYKIRVCSHTFLPPLAARLRFLSGEGAVVEAWRRVAAATFYGCSNNYSGLSHVQVHSDNGAVQVSLVACSSMCAAAMEVLQIRVFISSHSWKLVAVVERRFVVVTMCVNCAYAVEMLCPCSRLRGGVSDERWFWLASAGRFCCRSVVDAWWKQIWVFWQGEMVVWGCRSGAGSMAKVFCNFEYFKSTLLMTQIKLQLH